MKPAEYAYHRAHDVEDAIEQLESDSDAKLVAGGQSLLPLMNMRLASPTRLVDISRIDELKRVVFGEGYVEFGAAVTQSDLLAVTLPYSLGLLHRSGRHVGHEAIRNRGTFVGSLAHADPAAESLATALCLDAAIRVTGPRGSSTRAIADHCAGPFMTTLEPDELIEAVRFPVTNRRFFGFHEVARRQGDFAMAGACISAELGPTSLITARVVLFGVSGVPIRLEDLESAMTGLTIGECAEVIDSWDLSMIEGDGDIAVSQELRRHLARASLRHAFRDLTDVHRVDGGGR